MIEDGAESAEIIRSKRVGRDQDPVDSVVAVIANCTFVPSGSGSQKSSTEDNDRRSQVATTGSLYAPEGAPVPQPSDKMRIRGEVWVCAGRPDIWRDLDGQPQGYEQRVERVTG